MNTHVRHATFADAPGIARVHVDAWRSSYAGIVPEEILSGLSYSDRQTLWNSILNSPRSGTHCFVAETQKAEIVGFACGGPGRERIKGYEGEIYSIYLLQDYQRQGLGRRLLLSVTRGLLDDGIDSMLLWVFENNHGARQFYASLGGEVVRKKDVQIGGADLVEVAYGWKDIADLVG